MAERGHVPVLYSVMRSSSRASRSTPRPFDDGTTMEARRRATEPSRSVGTCVHCISADA